MYISQFEPTSGIDFFKMYSKEQAKQISQEFWIVFARRCEIVPELKSRKKKWILYDTGLKGIDLKFETERKSVSVILEINDNKPGRRNEIFETILKYKNQIEEWYSEPLIWDNSFVRDSGQEVCRIYKTLEGVNFLDKLQWPDIFNFMIDNMLILEQNFLKIKDIIEFELY